ncbi:MAG: 5-formyltetrahydrofolate cyclo-ligase [Oligoflexus sp.]
MQNPKQQLRLQLKEKRRTLDAAQRNDWSARICAHLENWLAKRQLAGIFGFRSFADEVWLNDWLDFMSQRIPVALPIARLGGQMDFHRYVKGQELFPNQWGIEEPSPHEPMILVQSETVILVPALAISPFGHRLGYGGGFYDRFLARYPQLVKVGVVFECFADQLVPMEEHDIPVDYICHQNGIYPVPTAGP